MGNSNLSLFFMKALVHTFEKCVLVKFLRLR